MKRINYTIANWKMNGSENSIKIVKSILKHIQKTNNKNSKIVICPPFTLLSNFIKEVPTILYGAQDCHHLDNGAYTGSISAKMIKSIGCKYVIIGHSERREYQKEKSEELKLKILKALSHNLKVIYCIGEKSNEIGKRYSVLEKQINSLPNVFNTKNVILAYEPVWAIGTGKIPSFNEIDNTHLKIRSLLSKKIGTKNSENISILYGGSVNALNAKGILSMEQVNGVLVGGASLKSKEFSKIIDSY